MSTKAADFTAAVETQWRRKCPLNSGEVTRRKRSNTIHVRCLIHKLRFWNQKAGAKPPADIMMTLMKCFLCTHMQHHMLDLTIIHSTENTQQSRYFCCPPEIALEKNHAKTTVRVSIQVNFSYLDVP